MFDFVASGQFQINLTAGERVEVFKESSGWFKGQVVERPDAKGIFPVSFIKLEEAGAEATPASPEPASPPATAGSQAAATSAAAPAVSPTLAGSEQQQPASEEGESGAAASEKEEDGPKKRPPPIQATAISTQSEAVVTPTPTSASSFGETPDLSRTPTMAPEIKALKSDMSFDVLLSEVTHCMREWSQSAQTALMNGSNQDFHHIRERMLHLLKMRHELCEGKIGEERKKVLRGEIIQLIEQSRKMQEGYMVVRNQDGQVADTSNTGALELLELHRDMYSKVEEEKKAALARNSKLKGGEDSKGSELSMKGHLQLFLDVKMCIFAVGEDTELFFSLWSDGQKKFVTEDFMLRITAAGMPVNLKLLNKMMTVFKDIEPKDMASGLYLVCKIFRSGRLVQDNSKKKPPQSSYRRPFGAAAFNLTNCGLEKQFGKELTPPNSAMTIFTPALENQFDKLHEMIIAKDKNILIAPRAKGIALGLTLFQGLLGQVLASPEGSKLGEVPQTNKLDFPEVLNPGETRNDFYVVLQVGNFLQDKKKSAKNVEIRVKVMLDNGNRVENCILRGTGDSQPMSEYCSSVYYHLNNPVYAECIRLQIDPDIFERTHLFITFYHVSTSASKTAMFAFGYLPLTAASGAVIPNQEHKIRTWKPFSSPKIENKDYPGGAFYLKGDEATPKIQSRGKEYFTVSTILCSTKKTQNDTLHSLFKWKEIKEVPKLKQHLGTFTSLGEGLILTELAKFVREAFDVFFGILSSPSHAECFDAVFGAIIHSLALLTDKKLLQYRSLVDAYIRDVFKDAKIHQTLLNLCSFRLEAAKDNPDQNFMRMAKCLNYVFKLVVQSRAVDLEQVKPSCDPAVFKEKLVSTLNSLNDLVRKVPEGKEEKKRMAYLLPSQSYLVRNFPELLQELEKVFTPEELAHVAGRLLEAIPTVAKQTLDKLNLIRNLLDGQVGQHPESRAVVVPIILKTLKTHLREIDQGSLTEPYLCMAILSKMLAIMQKKENIGETKAWAIEQIVEEVIHAVRLIQRYNQGEIQLTKPTDTVISTTRLDLQMHPVTVLWTILFSMTKEEITSELKGKDAAKQLCMIEELLQIGKSTLQTKVFPDLWISMNFLQLAVTGKLLGILLDFVTDFVSTAGAPEADRSRLGFLYLEDCLLMLMHEYLQLEKFSKQKRQFIEKRHGDLRAPLITGVRAMWMALGNLKLGMMDLVPRLFDLQQNFTSPSKDLGQDLYFDLVCGEFEEKKNFDSVERFTVDALYNIANVSNESGQAFVEEFTEVMNVKFATVAALTERGVAFLKHINQMYVLMSSLLRLPATALYEDERTSAALKILKYLDSSRHVRKDMYIQYTQNLVDLHESLGNYCEAGMAVLGQIGILQWSDEVMGGQGRHPSESERDRKERLYRAAIDFFMTGEEYEKAIQMCEELRVYCQQEIYDYEKLSQILLQEAQLYKKIVASERFYSNYFRVVYHGDGFDEEIREKEFVYRGVRLEPVMDFTNRIKKKFQDAYILMASEKPSDALRGQYPKIISITTLQRPPHSERVKLMAEWDSKNNIRRDEWCKELKESEAKARVEAKMPVPIRTHRDNNNLQIFVYSVPVQKGGAKPKNAFKELWVRQTYVYSAESFPNNRRRIEVIDRKEIWISPVENAIQSISEKNIELREKINAVKNVPDDQPVDLNPLTMGLNGILDAAVNGGARMYVEAFLHDDFLKENPKEEKAQKALIQTLRDQQTILKDGMEVFGKRCGESLQGLFEHLKKQFGLMVDKTKEVLF